MIFFLHISDDFAYTTDDPLPSELGRFYSGVYCYSLIYLNLKNNRLFCSLLSNGRVSKTRQRHTLTKF